MLFDDFIDFYEVARPLVILIDLQVLLVQSSYSVTGSDEKALQHKRRRSSPNSIVDVQYIALQEDVAELLTV